MSLSLHTIKPAKGAIKRKKRIGRGNASGHGSYSTRGLKGQRSRSGGRNKLKRLGFKKILAQTPKMRGFKSGKPKNQAVNLEALNKVFTAGAKINVKSLLKAGLVNSAPNNRLKVSINKSRRSRIAALTQGIISPAF